MDLVRRAGATVEGHGRLQRHPKVQRFNGTGKRPLMAALAQPALRLQPKHTHRPYGGGWWPDRDELSLQLLDLRQRWPSDRPSIVNHSFLRDDWDRSEAEVHTRNLTRTLVLLLSDGSSCRLLMVPHHASCVVAEQILVEASDPRSTWSRMDFATFDRSDVDR